MPIFLTGGNGMLGRAMLRIATTKFPSLEIICERYLKRDSYSR